jgi:tetratricopeptide (TPR) repeat protein
VIGQRFGLGELLGLVEVADIEADLEALRRKGLVAGGDDTNEEYRFRHLLIRDAAYGSLPKADRASLHDRLRSVLEAESGDSQQIAEILAHHAERSFNLSTELGLDGEIVAERGEHALRWLLVMADRARTRNDIRILEETLASLKTVAGALPAGGGIAVQAQLRLLGAQLRVMKADYRGAQDAAAAAAVFAEQAGLPSLVATARIIEAWIVNWALEGSVDEFERAAERAIEASRRAGDAAAEIEARHLASNSLFARGRLEEFVEINQRLLDEARSIGNAAHTAAILDRLINVEQMRGNAEVADRYMAEADALATNSGLRDVAANLMRSRGHRLRLAGDLTAADQIFRQLQAASEDTGAVQQQVSSLRWIGYGLISMERYAEAARALDRALELSEASGERWNRSELLGLRARVALESGDTVSADQFIESALHTLREDDVAAVSEVHTHLGVILDAQDRAAEAEAALRKAVQVVATTEYNNISIPAALELALVLARHGKYGEAAQICSRYSDLAHVLGWHQWDALIDRIRALLESDVQAGT